MSLSEALLLDPYPFEIFIAYRTDGVKGSGTLNDPYDGSTQYDIPFLEESDLGFPPTNPVSDLLALGASSESGSLGTGFGLITQFTFTPIPGPTCLALVSCFVTALAFRAARKRFKRD